MKNDSLWKDGINSSFCPGLDKNLNIDILIIGGGITGISAAYHLINQDKKVALVEKNRIGSGVTSKTTGKLTFLQENIYTTLKKYHNKETAKLYLSSQIDAIEIVKAIIKKNKIECNLTKSNSYIFTDKEKDIKKIQKEEELLNEFGISTTKNKTLPGIDALYNIGVSGTYVFHPIKYVLKLKEICLENKIEIYENTSIYSIDKKEDVYICQTENNTIKAKYVIIANHYPFFLFPFFLPMKTTLEKSYVSASIIDKITEEFNAINISKPTISVRYHKDRKNYLIKLTGSHNIAFKNNEKDNFSKLNLVNKNIEYAWSNIDIYTNDYLPYIGAIKDNLLIGTGYNTWGMTNGTLAGKILSDLILEKENKYIPLFNPRRGINLGKVINFPMSVLSSTKSFLGSKINKKKFWYNNVFFTKINGENVAIYIDSNNKKHIVYNKCPHMKCSLLFNEVEHTWDCPCHGSRFDIDGNVIEGPSNYNIKYKER